MSAPVPEEEYDVDYWAPRIALVAALFFGVVWLGYQAGLLISEPSDLPEPCLRECETQWTSIGETESP